MALHCSVVAYNCVKTVQMSAKKKNIMKIFFSWITCTNKLCTMRSLSKWGQLRLQFSFDLIPNILIQNFKCKGLNIRIWMNLSNCIINHASESTKDWVLYCMYCHESAGSVLKGKFTAKQRWRPKVRPPSSDWTQNVHWTVIDRLTAAISDSRPTPVLNVNHWTPDRAILPGIVKKYTNTRWCYNPASASVPQVTTLEYV